MKNMDDRADIDYSIIEEKFINDTAKYKVGDVVYYENDEHTMTIGIVHERLIVRKPIIRNKQPAELILVGYRIVHPKGIVLVTEPYITSASQYIFRQYLNNQKAD